MNKLHQEGVLFSFARRLLPPHPPLFVILRAIVTYSRGIYVVGALTGGWNPKRDKPQSLFRWHMPPTRNTENNGVGTVLCHVVSVVPG